jgi:hypothetical protein
MAEQYKLTSAGEFGFAECPLNPGLKNPGTSGFLAVRRMFADIEADVYFLVDGELPTTGYSGGCVRP